VVKIIKKELKKMAIVITSINSSILEPLRKNRFVFQVTPPTTLSTKLSTTVNADAFAFAAKSCSIPQISFNALEQQRMNERFFFAGKPTWNDLSTSFYDYIVSATSQSCSPGDFLWAWCRTIYDPQTGVMGYKSEYHGHATIAMLDPGGVVIRAWNIYYMFPTSISWGDTVGSEDEGVVECTATFKYDYAIKTTPDAGATTGKSTDIPT
jgi:hypothetical protein